MVYIGIGILAASLSFLLYKHGLSNKLSLYDRWKWRILLQKLRIISDDEFHCDDQSGCNIINVVEGDRCGNAQQTSETDNNSKSSQKSPKPLNASEIKPENGPLIPSLTLDDDRNDNLVIVKEPNESFNVKAEIKPPPVHLENLSSKAQQMPPGTTAPLTRPTPIPGHNPQNQSNSLMPPPPRPSANNSLLRPLPKLPTTLHPPPSAASILRTPPSNSLAPSSRIIPPSTSTLAPSNRPSKKVLLDPGHSPLDWANLVNSPPTPTFLRGPHVPPNLIRVPPSLLKQHNGRKGQDAWGVWKGRVYNLTPYMKFHPGGVNELMKAAGREKDGERLFLEVHPWISWESILGECLVGILVGEKEAVLADGSMGSCLDEMD